ncbi:MAG: hypothetical protein DRJ10_02985 [Bacteroidetes bacterium]|nr:MAG: hypothetical protein DRJ10_02985 [Bacteroidota bacterium]
MKHLEKIKLSLLYSIIYFLIFHPFNSQSQTILKVPAYPHETCIVDYDLDGDNDIIVGCSRPNQGSDSIVIFFNDGWGNFVEVKFESANRTYIYCDDLTADNYPDIITRFPGSPDGVYFYENDKEGGLGPAYFIKDMVGNTFIGGVADIDNNGYMDIVNYDISTPWEWGVAFNNGDYTFRDSAFVQNSESDYKPNVGRINNDTKQDILVTTYIQNENLDIFYNYYPNFDVFPLATADWGEAHIMKIDNDDQNDILLETTLSAGTTWITGRLNKGEYFRACDTLVYTLGKAIRNTCDYDLDGYDDITMTAFEDDSIYLYFNDQNCGFPHRQSIYMFEYSWLPTVNSGDLNSDGYPELVIQGYHMPRNSIRILWNDGTGHFVDTNTVYVSQPEIQSTIQLEIYPNPTDGDISIKAKNARISSFLLLDINGRIILNKEWTTGIKEFHINLKRIGLKQGIYICHFQMKDQTNISKKIIIKNPD